VSKSKIGHDSKLEDNVSRVGIVLSEDFDDWPGFFDS